MIPTRIQTHRRLWTGVCASGAPSRRSDSVCGGSSKAYHSTVDPVQTALQEAGKSGQMPSGSSILLAVSGGADSMALLYAARALADSAAWQLSVGHVHHGWRGRQADRDLAF